MLNVLRCQLTYEGQAVTNAEAWFNTALRPRKPEGSLGRTAQGGHLDSHTAPELWARGWVGAERDKYSHVSACHRQQTQCMWGRKPGCVKLFPSSYFTDVAGLICGFSLVVTCFDRPCMDRENNMIMVWAENNKGIRPVYATVSEDFRHKKIDWLNNRASVKDMSDSCLLFS